MAEMDKERILAGCDEAQRAAITSSAAPLLVIAGAGAGKTSVLTKRIAWRVASGEAAPSHVLALTFTRKAASELRTRLFDLGLPAPVAAGTFHSLALGQLRTRALDEGHEPPTVLSSKSRLLARIVPSPTTKKAGGRPAISRGELVSAVAAEIEWAKARRISPDRYPEWAETAHRTPPAPIGDISAWYAAYEEAKSRSGQLDFEDLLERLATAIQSDRSFAAVQRWRFRHIFVDELQDANAAQLRLLDAWLGARDDLFCVGDARQAIYGWNGADSSAVTRFAEHYPGATVIELSTNYRSTPQVVSVASSVFGDNAKIQSAPSPDGEPPTVTTYETEIAEAAAVVAALRRRRVPGTPWSSCAVLARTNAQLAVFEEALDAHAIPFRASSRDSLRDRPEVRASLALLAKNNTASFSRWIADLRDELSDEEPDDGRFVLFDLASEYAETEISPTPSGFRAFFDSALREQAPLGRRDGVDLLTFHRAKGLEWPVVFVTGIEDGYLPIAHARDRAAVDEERRLFYVALSRATSELHCSWSKRRTLAGREQARHPSPFLAEVAATCRAIERGRRFELARAKESLASVRALLDSTAPSS